MALTTKEIAKIAEQIRDRLCMFRYFGYRNLEQKLEQLAFSSEWLRSCQRQLKLCVTRKWLKAAHRLSEDLDCRFRSLRYDLDEIQNDRERLEQSLPRPGEIAAELRQAEKEFGQLVYDRKQNFVSAVTEPITLEGIYLGEFEIRLQLAYQGDCHLREMFKVVAQDPHPADCDGSVTHPHVRAENLCAGQAESSIREALLSGRLCDFFLLVRSVLSQYNSASPHVSLEHWENSTSCFDCGSHISGESNYCPTCENEFCNDCISYCQSCQDSFCQSCLTECKGCEEHICNSCILFCSHCKNPLCKTCLKNKQCPCMKNKEPEKELEKDEDQSKPDQVQKARSRIGQRRTRRQTAVRAG
jgi:hypothetical protein